MNDAYWNIEFWRTALFVLIGCAIGAVTGYWLAGMTIASIGYSAWLLFKLNRLIEWLNHKPQAQTDTQSSGIWECIESKVRQIHRKSQSNKKRTKKLLKRLQGIVKGLPDATIILNEDNEIDWANPKALTYLNVDISKDRGQRIDNLLRSPELVKLIDQHQNADIETDLPHQPNRRLAIQFVPVKKDLKLILARDISEHTNVQQMRKNFIANASHELRTPLTVISGYLEMMSEDDQVPTHLKPAVKHAANQSQRMKNIIEDMLTLSRLEKSELDLEACGRVNMPEILRRICDNELNITAGDSHEVCQHIDADLHLLGIESELVSVCSNLIQNAIRHTPAGTRITIAWHLNELCEAQISVKDNGPGIPAEHLPNLTQRFYRVDKNRSSDKGGTGLGLAIVQHILKRHGGRLHITSKINQGSCFAAMFPHDKVINDKQATH